MWEYTFTIPVSPSGSITFSFLMLADRAKAIKTKAVINESPTDKLIRELREENARLMEALKKGGGQLPMDDVSGTAPEKYSQQGMTRRECTKNPDCVFKMLPTSFHQSWM